MMGHGQRHGHDQGATTAAELFEQALGLLGLDEGDWSVTLHASGGVVRKLVAARPAERREHGRGHLDSMRVAPADLDLAS